MNSRSTITYVDSKSEAVRLKSVGDRLRYLSVADTAYYCAYALYLSRFIFENSTFEIVFGLPISVFETLCDSIVILLLLIKMLFSRARIKEWAIAIFAVAAAFISWIVSDEGWAFWLTIFIVCGQGVSIKRLAFVSACVYALLVPTICLFALTGAIDNIVEYRGLVMRQSLGFEHPNMVGMYLFLMCVSLSTFRFGKNPLPDIILLGVSVVFNLAFADSRSTAALGMLQMVLLVVFCCTKADRLKRAYSAAFAVCIVAAMFLSLFLMVEYDSSNSVMRALDSALSGRLYLANAFFKIGGITLLGNSYSAYAGIHWTGGSIVNFLVDNAYCHLLLREGLIPFVLLMIGFLLLVRRVVTEGRWDALLFGIVLMSAYGLTETYALRAENFFLLSIASLVLYPQTNVSAEHANDAKELKRTPSGMQRGAGVRRDAGTRGASVTPEAML